MSKPEIIPVSVHPALDEVLAQNKMILEMNKRLVEELSKPPMMFMPPDDSDSR